MERNRQFEQGINETSSVIRMPYDTIGELRHVTELDKSGSDMSGDNADTSRLDLDDCDDDCDRQSTNTSSYGKARVFPVALGSDNIITINGETGMWANKADALNWRGPIPLIEYGINSDPNPEIVKRKPERELVYNQEIAIRYLRPPTPPPPGEIIIKQESDIVAPPAPPLILRQQPSRPETPPPLVIREKPPTPPNPIGQKIITIAGKQLPPPPRKVVIERLPPIPIKPQSVIIERWLPYKLQKRKVIFLRAKPACETAHMAENKQPKNLIIQWEPPTVRVRKEFKDLGVFRANPNEYTEKYGTNLKHATELPDFINELDPSDVKQSLFADKPMFHELDGDIEALSLIDLDKEGLSEYRNLVHKYENLPRPKPHMPLYGRSVSALGITDESLNDTMLTIPRRPMSSMHTFKSRFDADKIINDVVHKIEKNQGMVVTHIK
jgi:hypothetical protein